MQELHCKNVCSVYQFLFKNYFRTSFNLIFDKSYAMTDLVNIQNAVF